MNLTIIKQPIITEKSLQLAGQHRYTFAVDPQATKQQIKAEIGEIFHVKVLSISTINLIGKRRHHPGKRTFYQKPNWKKAIVELPSHQKIDLFETQAEQKSPKTKKSTSPARLATKQADKSNNQKTTSQEIKKIKKEKNKIP